MKKDCCEQSEPFFPDEEYAISVNYEIMCNAELI